MSRKTIYQCERCIQLFSGRVAFDYHMNAHRRTDPPKKKEIAPKRPRIWYNDTDGNPPDIDQGEPT